MRDYRVNDFGRCLNCGGVHPTCRTPGCNNPTHCPPDEPGEPFVYCDRCDADMGAVSADLVNDRSLADTLTGKAVA